MRLSQKLFAGFLLCAAFVANPLVVQAQDAGRVIEDLLDMFTQPQQRPADPGVGQSRSDMQRQRPPLRRNEAERRVPFSAGEIQLSFAPLVQQAGPAVVNVYATQQVQARSPFAGDPFFEQFFGNQFGAPPRAQSSLGSGVLVDASGLVVTNNHVIENADEIKVALADGREFESTVVLRDNRLDLAVLRINARERFPILDFEDSDQLQTGDLVLAIGNPFGVGQTITQGIISATARNRVGVSDFGFFIQTDAAINPGNSGGALIDMHGKLIGINTAIFSRSGGSNGIGFAIPSNMVRAFVEQAKGGAGAFERPYLGADFEPVTAQIAESLGLRRPSGALVNGIDPQGPAAKAGLRVGDVVLSFNGHSIEHPDALGYRLATVQPGELVDMGVIQRGRNINLRLRLTKAPETVPAKETVIPGRSPFAGAVIANISPRVLDRLGMRGSGEGVIITKLENGGNAARAGFAPGDVIVSINGDEMQTVDDVLRATDSTSRNWRFEINRGGQRIRQYLRF